MKTNGLLLAMALPITLLFSCHKDENINDVPVVTGYKKFTTGGEPNGLKGTPNDLTLYVDSSGATYRLYCAPNPFVKYCMLLMAEPGDGTAAKHLIVRRARADGQIPDPYPMSGSDPDRNKLLLDTIISTTEISLDMSRFPLGYLRAEVSWGERTLNLNLLHLKDGDPQE